MGLKRLKPLSSSNKTHTLQLKEKAEHSSCQETMQLRPRSRLMCQVVRQSQMCTWPWNLLFNQHKPALFGTTTVFGLRPPPFTTARLVLMECSLQTVVGRFGISTPDCKVGPSPHRPMSDSTLQTVAKTAPLEIRLRPKQVPPLSMQLRQR